LVGVELTVKIRKTQSKTVVYSVNTSTVSPQSFSVCGPASWNALPPTLRDPHLTLESLSWLLKTALFSVGRLVTLPRAPL